MVVNQATEIPVNTLCS